MAIVTLSRQMGAGGSDIAAGVAKALGLRIIDREAIDLAAIKVGVPEIALHELGYEGQRNLIQRILDALMTSPAIPSVVEVQRRESVASLTRPPRGIFTPTMPLLSAAMEDYVRMVGMVLLNIAQEGNVLIVGRGSQVVLKEKPEVLHVKVVAPLARRIEKLMYTEGLTQSEARRRLLASDQARADYLRRYYGVNWLDPQLYDLVINTGRVSFQTAVQLVVLTQVQRVMPETHAASSSPPRE